MNAPKPKPIEVKVGNVIVKIYRVLTRGHDSYQVADYSSGRRKLISFSDLSTAKARAAEIARKMLSGDTQALQLSNKDRSSYVRALDLLKPTGTPLEVAALHFAEAVKILGSDLVIEAANFYAKRHCAVVASKTVPEVFEELLADAKARKLSSRYIEDLQYRCGKFAATFHMPIGSVGSSDIRQFLTGLNLSPRSHNNFVGAIHRLFEFAKGRKYLPRDHDEMADIDLVKDTGGEIEVFSPVEMSRLLAAAPEDVLPLVAIGGFAGLRSAEIERLEWSDLDFVHGHIKVTAKKGKTASRRIIPITPNLASWLKPYSNRSGQVWPHGHAYYYESLVDLAAATATDEHPEPVVWKHNALRHSFISYRVAGTLNVNQVALEAGNTPQMIFRHYRELVSAAEAQEWFSIQPK